MAVAGETVRAPAGMRFIAWLRRYRFELALVLPMLTYVVVLTIAPILDTIRISFTSRGDLAFPSMASYQTIFRSEVFQAAVVNTLFVALLSLAVGSCARSCWFPWACPRSCPAR
jgi:trehalose transport system permease protein